MEDLYLKIAARLHALIPELDHIDEDTGQLYPVQYDDRFEYPILFPCLLIDASTVDWKDEKIVGSQRGSATVTLKLAFRMDEDTHFEPPSFNDFEQLRMRRAIERRIAGALHCYCLGDGMSPLYRTISRSYSQPGRVRVTEMTFKTNITDKLQVGEE